MECTLGITRNNYSHAHADYNAFTLFARGQYFIIPPGYARRSSGFQNVVSVNGSDFVVDPSINVRIVAFRDEKRFSYAVGDATEAFPDQLGVQQYNRHILLLDSRWMVIFDDLRLSELGRNRRSYNRFIWTVHSGPASHQLSISGNKTIWKPRLNSEPTLTMHSYWNRRTSPGNVPCCSPQEVRIYWKPSVSHGLNGTQVE